MTILGGAEHSLLDFLSRLNRQQFKPALLVPQFGPLVNRAKELGIRTFILPIDEKILKRQREKISPFSWQFLRDAIHLLPVIKRLKKLIQSEGFDLLHTNTLKMHLIGGIAAKLVGVPVVWHFRDILKPGFVRSAMTYLSELIPSRILSVSKAVTQQFNTSDFSPKTQVIYNCLDAEEYRKKAQKKSREEILKEFRFPQNARLVGVVGQIVYWKGQEFFIRAAAQVQKRFPEVRFLIIGDVLFWDFAYKERLQRLVEELQLQDYVIFAGFWDDSPALMNALEVVVHTSVEPEPFGRVLLEAIALGKQLVATRGGAVEEIVSRENAFLVPPKDVSALSQAITQALTEKKIIRGKNSMFNIEESVKRIEEIYREVLNQSTVNRPYRLH